MKRFFLLPVLAFAFSLAGCGDDVGSEEDARRAYLGLDASITKAMQLGFQGFNAASSANIDPQTGNGDKGGTITISGQVDQGSSDNKTMSLRVALKDYADNPVEETAITYNTNADSLPALDLKLSKIPTGTVDGTLVGSFTMTGDLEGAVRLNVLIAGELQPTAADPMKVERKPGTTKITGTAESDYGTYDVNVTH
ncbi:hypothetical protein [Polyangium aurulentum]|uniref:hypothetical protein n=1 Tax=Polyangium aurulentum TaxID=2567896 RepID=UPI0010AE7A1D|nr:hypothetical protein [Polyangium aurulentum]UQA55535.1 hypothetical protein E8A73_029850 [Polyangium aurulentum]